MAWFNKVSWSEGLFLRPQLFQQQERYLEQQAHLRCEPLGSLFWGFSALAIDPAALEGGSLQLLHARGVWPDGLAFDLPRMGPMPAPLRLEPAHAGQELLLALPACVAQAEDVSFEPEPPAGARYSVFDTELRDVNPFGSGPRSVQLLHMRARVLAAAELPQAWMGLPLARVGAVHADGRAQLDPQRLPVLNVLDADATLMRWLGELHAHIGQRASQLAQRLQHSAWSLIRLLGMHHLPLAELDAQSAAQALRELLGLFAQPADAAAARRIDGLLGARMHATTRRLPQPGPLVYGRTLECDLQVDDEAFAPASPLLFGMVLERLLGEYASINTCTSLRLHSAQRGPLWCSPARMGSRGIV